MRINWPHVWDQLRTQATRFLMVLVFVGTAVAGRTDQLPVLFQPYRNWFEVLGWIATVWTSVQVRPLTATQKYDRRWTDQVQEKTWTR